MRRSPARTALAAAQILAVAATIASCGSTQPRAHRTHPVLTVTVGKRPTGAPLAPGFLGLSLEYTAVAAYTDPAVVELIRELSPGQRPVIRIGGNSTDETFALSGSWLRKTAAFAHALHARMILGLNLAARRPGVARAESQALERAIGPAYIEAFELGNEPDLYGLFPWPGTKRFRRPGSYDLADLIREFSRWRAAIGRRLPVTGPAYATFDWSLGRFIDAERGLREVTFHRYAFDACLTNPSAAGYPTIRGLLGEGASRGLAARLAPEVAVAHAHGVRFRLDELNSASCGGKRGVSDTRASEVWILDTLFSLARVGVDGVNVHTFPGAAYAPFSPSGHAYPEYYGMLMFARAFPPGARLLPVRITPGAQLTAWATTKPSVVLINKSQHQALRVALHGAGRPSSITVPAASAVLVMK